MNSERLQRMTWTECLGAGLVLVAIYYFALFDNGERLVAQIKAANDNLNRQKVELDKLNQAKLEKEKTQQEMGLVSDQFRQVLQYLPTDLNQAELMRNLVDEARVVGAKNIHISPATNAPSEKADFYASVPIQIGFEANFIQTLKFLAAVTKIPRLLKIQSMDLHTGKQTSSAESPLLSFQGTLSGYRYVESKPVEKVEKK